MTARSLAESFRRLIATSGPMTLAHYMAEANARYYARADPLGTAGDFVTAPEISQMFGELIGLWLTDVWDRAGRPEPVHYVELGPGRGTLARDALRAMLQHGLAPQVHLIETRPRCARCNRQRCRTRSSITTFRPCPRTARCCWWPTSFSMPCRCGNCSKPRTDGAS